MDLLRALVNHANKLGHWIRFYTLEGFGPEIDVGWDKGCSFGSSAGVRWQWQAAIEAGVDMIATDQYQDLGALLRAGSRQTPRPTPEGHNRPDPDACRRFPPGD
jgi:hypothetical protein